MTQTENMVSEALSAGKKICTKEILSDDDLHDFVGEVYRIVVDRYLDKFGKDKTGEMTMQQYEDNAEMIMNMACTLISSAICGYADNKNCSSYELPSREWKRLMHQLSLIMQHESAISRALFEEGFNLSFYGVIKSAQQHKRMSMKFGEQN